MRLRAMALAAATALGLFAVPAIAEASWAVVVTDLNLRACASVRCARITVMPAGTRVWISGRAGGWYYVNYRGYVGYASASYIGVGTQTWRRPPAPAPYYYRRPPPPPYPYYRQPRWDPRYGAWYDGRRWYYSGRWYDQPSGFYFGFSFGR